MLLFVVTVHVKLGERWACRWHLLEVRRRVQAVIEEVLNRRMVDLAALMVTVSVAALALALTLR